MKKFISYPSIDQFRTVVKSLILRSQYIGKDLEDNPIYDDKLPLSNSVKFTGTVKLHGTNAAFVFSPDGISYQSRSAIITSLNDNAGFVNFYSNEFIRKSLEQLNKQFRVDHNVSDQATIAFFGEWCGGNIQSGVGLNQLEKRFVLFGIKEYMDDDNCIWYPITGIKDHSIRFYNIEDYKMFELELDLNNPLSILEKINQLTDEVEKECPFCKEFGIENGVGEGIVWHTSFMGANFRFKSKGEKHSVTKTKTKVSLSTEKLNNISEFIEYAVTENRLQQAIEQVFTTNSEIPDIKKTGQFLTWLIKDVVKEESDTLAENGITIKEVSGAISNKAKSWFFNYLDNQLESKNL